LSAELLLFLLLPVAALSGWLAANKKSKTATTGHVDFSNDYFTGLNYLLNEQPDKAVDVFVRMLEVDSDTVDTHLALGNLFRRRGEVDRAIRIHQNLIARPTLSKEQRAQALLELAKDYMRAGFLDRAENMFLELLNSKQHKESALDHLLDIFQQEKDWEKAIDISRQLEALGRKQTNIMSAHFCCELAELELQRGETRQALKTIRRALNFDKQSVRATLLLGNSEQHQGNLRSAIKIYKQIEKQDPTYLSEIVTPLLACYQSLGQTDEAESYLRQLAKEYGGTSVILALAELTRMKSGEKAAIDTLLLVMKDKPSLRGLERLLTFMLNGSQGETRHTLVLLQELVKKLTQNQSVYQCVNCGFYAKFLHWKCPTCKRWNTIKPRQSGIEYAISE